MNHLPGGTKPGPQLLTRASRHAMEELMRFAVKIILPVAIVATTVGSVVAYSYYHRPQHAASAAAGAPGAAAALKPSQDDAMKADASWLHWPSRTDF